MRKNKKIIIAISILTALVLLALPACSAGQKPSPASDASAASDAKPEVVQLDVFSASTASTASAGIYDNTWWGQILIENVGVSLNILPTGDQAQEKLQALMAGGELPDIVIFRTTKDVQSAVRGNLLTNLDEHLDKMPNVAQNAATALQYSRDNLSNDTGKVYAIPNGIGPSDLGDEPSWGPYIRWDLYKQIGAPEIATYEDYLTVLDQMKQAQPQNADGKNTYGITLWKDWDNYSMFLATEMGPTLGVDSGDQLGQLPFLEVDFKDGATKSILDTDSYYMKALNFYYKANQMGLVDPDSLTQTYDTAKSKLVEGRVLFAWWGWFADAYNTPEHVDADIPTGFAAVLPANTKTLIPCDNNIGKSWPFSISAKTKNLDACLRYIDFMYSAEGNQLLFNGPEGTIWERDAAGKPKIMDTGWQYINDLNMELPQGGKFSDRMMVGSYGLSSAFVNPDTKEPINYRLWSSTVEYRQGEQTNLQKDWTKAFGELTTIDCVRKNNMALEIPLAQSLIPTMTDDISASAARIGDIIKMNSWKMIFAKDDAEYQSLYNEMIEKADGLGIAEVYAWSLENWQTALTESAKYE